MSTQRLKTLIGAGLTLLVALMPLHAFIVLSLGHLVGHESLWAAWKEAVLVVLALATAYYVWREPAARDRLRQPVVGLIMAFAAVALLVTAITGPPLHIAIFGLKTDFEFLLAGVIALVVASQQLVRRLVLVFLTSTIVVVAFGLTQATWLPHNALSGLGYGFAPGQTAPYETVYVGHTLHYRFGSTLGGPNQLGTFLILPLGLSLLLGRRQRWWWLLSLAILPVLFVTYSRGAWLGAAASLIMIFLLVFRGRARLLGAALLALAAAVVILFAALGPADNPFSNYLHHTAPAGQQNSDSQHVDSIGQGTHAVVTDPLGHGLGTAGPATFHGSNINIIEDNFLQVGYETGLLGLVLFGLIIAVMVISLVRVSPSGTTIAAASALVGISLTALFLPAWTDSSTALTVWTLGGAALGARRV